MFNAKKVIIYSIIIFVVIIGLLFYKIHLKIVTKDEIKQTSDFSLVDLEKEFMEMDSPISSDYEPILAKMDEKAKEMLNITCNQKVEQVAGIFFGYDLEDNYRCIFLYADDTIHTTEFPECYTPIVVNKDSIVSFTSKYKEQNLKFYLGDPREMNNSGYSKIKEVTVGDNNQLMLEHKDKPDEMILFTIIKDEGDLLYKKYVWVLKFVSDGK